MKKESNANALDSFLGQCKKLRGKFGSVDF